MPSGDANGPSSTLVGLFMPNGWLSNAGRTTSAAMPSSKCAKSPFCVPNCKCWTCDSSKRLSEHEGGLPIVVPWFAQKAFCPPPHPTSAASVSIKHTKPFVQQRLQCKTSSKQLQEIIEVGRGAAFFACSVKAQNHFEAQQLQLHNDTDAVLSALSMSMEDELEQDDILIRRCTKRASFG
uniref:PLCG1 EF-hand domain-containing protein n=1 Tax=Globodera rostochiensis TaxID=31243 RepID=A0A914HLR9_GLORO